MSLPVCNLGFVALGSTLLWLLAGEAQPTQQMPQVADAVFDAEAFGDQLSYARQRPKFRRIPGGQCAGHEQLAQFALLLGIELAWTTQFAALETFAPVLRHAPLPAGHRLPCYAQPSRHFRLGHSARKQLAALQSAFLQRLEIPLVLYRRSSKRTQAD